MRNPDDEPEPTFEITDVDGVEHLTVAVSNGPFVEDRVTFPLAKLEEFLAGDRTSTIAPRRRGMLSSEPF